MTQLQTLSTGTELDDLAIWHAHVNDAITAANNIGAIFGATARILHYAFWLANQKAVLAKKEFNKILSVLGWSGEERSYLKVAEAFADYTPHSLAQIEPRTIFQLSGNLKRYQCVIDKFHTLAAITQDGVRGLIASTRKKRTYKPQPKASVWHSALDSGRVCVIMIYDEKTGVIIQKMADSEGRTPQYIVADGMELRQAYIDGRLVWACDVQEDTAPPQNQEASTLYEEELSFSNNNLDEIDEEILEVPIDWSEEEYEVEGTWSFEPDEKDDDIEDEEVFTKEIYNDSEKQPVDLLIEALQTARSWQEISVASKSYEEFKQQAWDALTPVERRRIILITPSEVKKLSQAKRNGKIIDFQEVREDVYRVQYSEYIFGEIVYKDRINDFLARL
ncbi:hypothetical protein NIES4071_77930 [Calothrix sp. NIES-4071]|nr:hypothetical protein NIES4071_77930 [Calothrix sp. NIES-4071]BAZ62066.1 hypothetical protein NIES4105_77870 [Calothrix sp. NIES-4105]